jgi:hypothetical protein
MSRKIIGVTVGTPTSPSTVKDKLKLATEEWVQKGYQPKGEYLTEVPDGYLTDTQLAPVRETANNALTLATIVDNAKGNVVNLSDSSDMELRGMKVFGKTTQNGIPTTESPVALESVGDGGSVIVKVGISETDENPQTLTIQKPTNVPVFLPGIPLVDIGIAIPEPTDYTDENGQQWFCDYVDFNRGVYVQKITKKVLDGTETWKKLGSTHHGTKIGAYGSIINGVQLSSHFVGVRIVGSNNNIGVYAVNSEAQDAAFIYIRRQVESMTNDELKAWLAENPVTVYYALSEPIEHDLSAEELAQYAALHTNYPNTTVYNNGGAGMEVRYVADTKLYIDGKFAELSAALLNQ